MTVSALCTPAIMDRNTAMVDINSTTWLEYDYDESVGIVQDLGDGVIPIHMTPGQALGVVSAISTWLISFFDNKADRLTHRQITTALWLQEVDHDLMMVSTRPGRKHRKKRVEILLNPETAVKASAALSAWLVVRPSWDGRGKIQIPKHVHYHCPVDCSL